MTSPSPTDALPPSDDFADLLLTWYEGHKRDLPWRRAGGDPYAVWVSEMMLQQTQVATVIPFYERWMTRFPTVAALADAPLDDVLKQWQGLGYYARARNMHRAARAVMETHDGAFPTSFEAVLALPGIGRYTAGAVCSIALGLPTPIVDANVVRVLCRAFGIYGDPKSAPVQARLWELAQSLLPPDRASAFNQGMMELGALVCQARPQCEKCPVQTVCVAFATGEQNSLPQFAPRPVFTAQTDVSAIITHPGDGRWLLTQRPPDGLWGGLWEFPRVTAYDGESLGDAATRAAREVAGLVVTTNGHTVGTVRHGVTTRKITLVGVACTLADSAAQPETVGSTAWAWADRDAMDTYALASPQVRLAAQVVAGNAQPTLF